MIIFKKVTIWYQIQWIINIILLRISFWSWILVTRLVSQSWTTTYTSYFSCNKENCAQGTSFLARQITHKVWHAWCLVSFTYVFTCYSHNLISKLPDYNLKGCLFFNLPTAKFSEYIFSQQLSLILCMCIIFNTL